VVKFLAPQIARIITDLTKIKICGMRMKYLLLSLSFILYFQVRSQDRDYPFRNPALSIDTRIDDLISHMSLEEKASQLLYNSPAIDRLGIPEYNWWNECLHGVARAGRATVFPQTIGLAATFDDDLIYRIADAISTEARAKYNEAIRKNNRVQYMGLSFWTPNINIFRDPRWGRGQETYGEDPYLTGRMGSAFVKGLQGNDPVYLKAAACAKHFAVHSGPEKTRHVFNAMPDEKDFRETYLPAFKALVDARVEAVMCAYNRLYDEPCCGSRLLLKDILRNEWGFKGHIVTDCWALDDIWLRHKVVSTEAEAAAMAARAGVNLNCGYIYKFIPQAIEQGLITAATVDSILRPLLKTRFRLGLFDPPESVPWANTGPEEVDSPEHRKLASEAAVKSIVLLQNKNQALPVNRDSIRKIFVTGPTAADVMALAGNYNGWSGDMVTLLEGITRAVDVGTVVDYSMGCLMNVPGNYTGFWEAKMADVIIVCLGNTRMMEGEEGDAMLNPEGGDRSDIRLPESQCEFIRLMRENVPDKPIIAIITGGSSIALQDVIDAADAVLFAWYPGEEGGTAVADIIFGKVNPSGRLPVTFYKSVDDLPPFDDYSMKGRTYRFFKGDPMFPFGFGLSYSKFEYTEISCSKSTVKQGDTIRAELTVTNTGDRAGEEVVLIYASKAGKPTGKKGSYFPEDEKSLVGFSRVYLEAGESKTIPLEAHLMDMHQWDEVNHRYFVEKGHYVLLMEPCGGGGFALQIEEE
jgi:beta-glucosidase